MKNKYQILLFYCYTKINSPRKFKKHHHLFCIKNNIRGRVIVSNEGINGTVSGTKTDCEKYIDELKSKKIFSGIDFKVENYHRNTFDKINVRVKDEIVNSGLSDKSLIKKRGDYITPNDFNKIIKKKRKNITVLDVRSNYEHNIGKFKNAITIDIDKKIICLNISKIEYSVPIKEYIARMPMNDKINGIIKSFFDSAYQLDPK